MNNPTISPRLKNGLLLLLLLAVPLVYLSLSFNDSVWTDEAFTMVLLRQDFAGITQGTIADVHPPLIITSQSCSPWCSAARCPW